MCCERNIDLRNIFVDYTQAFDCVYRNKIIECVVQYKVPAKLIRLIELTIINTTARIKINYGYAEEFKVESEVKEGDPLSATLFHVVVVVKQLDLRCRISTL